MADSEASRTKKKQGGLRETIRTVIYAVVIALVVRTVAIEPFNIPSGSMIPTLLVGDYLFVSKYSYGYSHYSLPFSPPLFPGRIFYSQPERGDVVVFKWPVDNKTDYIKRIIGLPGDTIAMRQGVLLINGQPVKLERLGPVHDLDAGETVRGVEYRETLPNGVSHMIIQQTTEGAFNNFGPIKVPSGKFFAMGDNRDRSQDSRVWGFVPKVNLIGRAEFLFFSTDNSASFWQVWKWPDAIRFSRIFESID